ncbi:hypothetical protein TIFTF001_022937 [Ficus carica]|uniref:non-specific serine/threonine protein kinase n=1 Tax=Ficus carica TaxID=3494 RepID=A0AA88DC46_FICCA|nr:hypothetical protein TIFTF001_022937 [Ficus carica]
MLPFSTSFIFSSSAPLYPNRDWAFAFVFFACFRYTRFKDNHVGLGGKSLTSYDSHEAGFWVGEDNNRFVNVNLHNRTNYQVWINLMDSRINVTVAPAGWRRPHRPLLSEFVNLSGVLLDHIKKEREREVKVENWELEDWPHRIGYREISLATDGFSDKTVIGSGGSGTVFNGVFPGGVKVAVKKISLESGLGMKRVFGRDFKLREIEAQKLGWTKSLDKRIFDCNESVLLTWEERVKVLKDVACGILYLHEGWEAKVLHRDIKASNELLDNEMNAKLGDFGLARMHHHGQLASTTRVVGTLGYMAPELVQTGRVSSQTYAFGFGVFVPEVVCGRRLIESRLPSLVDWVRRLMETGELLGALDKRLKSKSGYDIKEVEKLLLLGLLCVHPEPHGRPTMRQVVMILESGFDGADQTEENGMEAMLIGGRMEATSTSHWCFGGREEAHDTFEEIRHSLFSSASLEESDFIREGQ